MKAIDGPLGDWKPQSEHGGSPCQFSIPLNIRAAGEIRIGIPGVEPELAIWYDTSKPEVGLGLRDPLDLDGLPEQMTAMDVARVAAGYADRIKEERDADRQQRQRERRLVNESSSPDVCRQPQHRRGRGGQEFRPYKRRK